MIKISYIIGNKYRSKNEKHKRRKSIKTEN